MKTGADTHGLSTPQVLDARKQHGWNALPRPKRARPLTVFARQFTSVLIVILIVAAAIAYLLGERVDALAIGLVIALNGLLGFVQEWRAETALESLRSMLSVQAQVLRDGTQRRIDARQLVPGDVIILEAGDKVPADAVLTRAAALKLDESILTGESLPVEKSVTGQDATLYAGTALVAGRARAVVTAIGAATAFGQIAQMTGSVGTKKTHLQHQLTALARQLGLAALTVAAVILVLGLALGRDTVEMLMTALSLSVAMVPEGLPAVVTITLALGAAAMVRQQALARKLQAVETLGAASVICTDKTGTLTENKMTATQIWTQPRVFRVTGNGYDPMGQIEANGARISAADDPVLARLLQTALTCTHAHIDRTAKGWTMTGDPTEGALVTLAHKGGSPLPAPDAVLAEHPFSSDRKRMSVLARHGAARVIHTKGAPEQVLKTCTQIAGDTGPRALTPKDRAEILRAYEDMAAQGLRVIATAHRISQEDTLREQDLIFLGLVGLIDPPRQEVRGAIASALSAGIRVIMITGDSPTTAKAIGAQLGLHPQVTVTGPQLDLLEEAELDAVLAQEVLFARTKPAHKMRIVAALQRAGQIIAMTGDGVNDAPALKQADIGVAMGIRGTDVAKDASDLVLLDDNFATIIRAVKEGRRQFSNVQKFVRYLLSSNAGEAVALVINILIGGPLIFLATQILWMNLVTDGVTAVALGLEKAEPDEMRHPPRNKGTRILGAKGLAMITVLGLYTGLSSLWLFFALLEHGEDLARTTAFTAMVVFEKMSVFAFRSLHLACWKIGWLSNPLLLLALALTLSAQLAAIYWPPLQALLHTVPLGPDEWLMIGAFTLPILIVPELAKTLAQITR